MPAVLLTVSFILVLAPESWVQPVRDGVRIILSPVDRIGAPAARSVVETLAAVMDRRDGRAEIRRLNALIDELRIQEGVDQARITRLQRQLDSLREYTGATTHDSPWVPVPVTVLQKPSKVLALKQGGLRDGLLIAGGRTSGISPGAAVVYHYAVVGRVISAGLDTSEVQLLTDPAFRAAAITDKTAIEGIVQGETVSSSVMKHVLLSDKVEPNELVLTSGYGGVFPPGLVIGYVTVVSSTYDARFQRIEIKPAIVPEDLDTVLVLVRRDTAD